MIRLENQYKVDVNVLSDKINQFNDRKRHKIALIKEELDLKDVEECSFKPIIYTRKA